MPRSLRAGAAAALTAVSPDRWTSLLSALPSRLRPPQAGDKLHKVASVLKLGSADAIYRRLVSHWEPSGSCRERSSRRILDDEKVPKEFQDLLARMQFLDLVTYLPDDILTKVDRASMAVALEARVPLLDHRVVEFFLAVAGQRQSARRHQQMAVAAGALSPRSAGAGRAAEDGIWHSAWRVAARPLARLGRDPARRKAATGSRVARCRTWCGVIGRTTSTVAAIGSTCCGTC